MKNHVHTLSAFLKSLCICAFPALVLFLCTLTACSYTADAQASHSSPAPLLSEQPSPSPSLFPTPLIDPPSVSPAQDLPNSPEAPSQIQNDLPSESVPQSQVPPSPALSETPALEPSPKSSAQPDQSNSENSFQAVLRGNASFFSTDANQNLTVNELNRTVSDDSSVTAKLVKFAVVDLDGDSEQEVVLWFEVNEYNDFFEVLRQYNGQIYGYTFGYRAMNGLKQDGTFSFSSGAADSGFWWLSFSDIAYTTNRVTYSESSYNAINELTVNYYVNGQPASESEYLSAMEEQMAKDDVLWFDFTGENIALKAP